MRLGLAEDKVLELYEEAVVRWGDVPISVKTTCWENGEYCAEAFHTVGRIEDGRVVRARLIYWSHHDQMVERFDELTLGTRENLYEEEDW